MLITVACVVSTNDQTLHWLIINELTESGLSRANASTLRNSLGCEHWGLVYYCVERVERHIKNNNNNPQKQKHLQKDPKTQKDGFFP